jgi:hypothetical protein
MMSVELRWMQPEAPYMTLATVGLLAVMDRSGVPATAGWTGVDPGGTLTLSTDVSVERLAECILEAPWPDLDAIPWGPKGRQQALRPTLAKHSVPLAELHRLIEQSGPTESRLLRAILCDGALDAAGSPLRSRLLRGVKSDLSSIGKRPKRIKAEGLAKELVDGPDFVKGSSGLGLGFVPEIHTFGATTGPAASTVGVYSPLLYLLLWHGIMALPPVPVARGRMRSVGGPLVSEPDVLSWPRWRCSLGLRSLTTLLTLPSIHEGTPNAQALAQRDIDAVFRAHAEPINSMIAVFRWGDRVA